jgi:hypothetical protein
MNQISTPEGNHASGVHVMLTVAELVVPKR